MIGRRPAKNARSTAHRQRRIRHAARHDNVRAGLQGDRDAVCAEVGVGGDETIRDG